MHVLKSILAVILVKQFFFIRKWLRTFCCNLIILKWWKKGLVAASYHLHVSVGFVFNSILNWCTFETSKLKIYLWNHWCIFLQKSSWSLKPGIKNLAVSSLLTSLINNQNNFIKQSLKITIKNMLINNNNKKQKYPDCSMETPLLNRIILWCSDVLAALLTPHWTWTFVLRQERNADVSLLQRSRKNPFQCQKTAIFSFHLGSSVLLFKVSSLDKHFKDTLFRPQNVRVWRKSKWHLQIQLLIMANSCLKEGWLKEQEYPNLCLRALFCHIQVMEDWRTYQRILKKFIQRPFN